jgi:TetR/AcrR family transcriptional regulator, ethionamide resistance regulator
MAAVARKGKTNRAERREHLSRRLFGIVERLLAGGMTFSEISVEQLITEAGIARSTFYVYFEDKGALAIELLDQVTRVIGAAASDWFDLPASATRDDLHRALSRLAEGYREHGRMLSAVIDAAAYEPRVREQYAAVMERRCQDMNEALTPQQMNGAIRADVDIPSVTVWLLWMFERGLHQFVGAGDQLSAEALNGATTIVWKTLYDTAR